MSDQEKKDAEDKKAEKETPDEEEKEGKRYTGGVIPKSRSSKKNED